LASNGPMNLINISEKVIIKKALLIKYLRILQNSSLIVKENFGKNKVFFTITESGLAVLRIFKPVFANECTTQTIDLKELAILL
jgi:predicted transcriptional regulator